MSELLFIVGLGFSLFLVAISETAHDITFGVILYLVILGIFIYLKR